MTMSCYIVGYLMVFNDKIKMIEYFPSSALGETASKNFSSELTCTYRLH